MEELVKNNWQLGGENSGHIICFDKATTGDATISALQVLIAMWREEKSLYELKSEMTKLPQILKNVRVREKTDPMSNEVIAKAVQEQGERLAGQGRVLLRASGTEPLIRVMAEGEDARLVNSVVDALVETSSGGYWLVCCGFVGQFILYLLESYFRMKAK